MEHHHVAAKHLLDALSIGVVVGAIVQFLPAIAAGLSIVWTAIRIYETRTVQRLIGAARNLLSTRSGGR